MVIRTAGFRARSNSQPAVERGSFTPRALTPRALTPRAPRRHSLSPSARAPRKPMSWRPASVTYAPVPMEEPEMWSSEASLPMISRSRGKKQTIVHDRDTWRVRLECFLIGLPFQCCVAVVILANAIAIGGETEMPDFRHWDVVEAIFLVAFTIELVLKLVSSGPREYFAGADCVWNLFDVVIVSTGIVNLTFNLLVKKPTTGLTTLFRTIKLLRIVRVLRLVRFMRKLYLLAFGFIEAAKAVFWVTILMMVVIYACAVVLSRTVGQPSPQDDHADFMSERYGSIVLAMWTLFELMASPTLQEYHAQTGLLTKNPLFGIFLVAFVIFGSFGMIALLTGVITESMFEKNQLRSEAERLEQEYMHGSVLDSCEEVFDSLGDGELEVSEESIRKMAPPLRRILEEEGVDFTDHELRSMICLLDTDHSGAISKDEFLSGVSRLVLGLRPVPIQEIAYQVSFCKLRIEQLSEDFRNVSDALDCVMKERSASEDDGQFGELQASIQGLQEATRAQGSLLAQVGCDVKERFTSESDGEIGELRASVQGLQESARAHGALLAQVGASVENMRGDLLRELREVPSRPTGAGLAALGTFGAQGQVSRRSTGSRKATENHGCITFSSLPHADFDVGADSDSISSQSVAPASQRAQEFSDSRDRGEGSVGSSAKSALQWAAWQDPVIIDARRDIGLMSNKATAKTNKCDSQASRWLDHQAESQPKAATSRPGTPVAPASAASTTESQSSGWDQTRHDGELGELAAAGAAKREGFPGNGTVACEVVESSPQQSILLCPEVAHAET